MNKILPFIRLDLYTLKPYRKSLLLIIAIAVVMTIVLKSLTLFCLYLMMFLILMMIYPFSIGETNRLDTLYATLSLRRRNIVVGRYVFALCMEIVVALVTLIFTLILSAVTGIEFIASDIFLYFCLASFAFSFIVSFQFPIYFKFGYNKAKFIALIPLYLVVFLVTILPNLIKDSSIGFSFDSFILLFASHTIPAYGLTIIAGLLLLAASCGLSCRIYEKRDI